MDDRREQSGQRFVLLRHELPPASGRPSHWDLMLENRGKLLTWELPQLPEGRLPATFHQLGIRRLPDHRLAYLDYEGPVSGNRGRVERVDFGRYAVDPQSPRGGVRLKLAGEVYEIELELIKGVFCALVTGPVDAPVAFAAGDSAIQTGEVRRFSKVTEGG